MGRAQFAALATGSEEKAASVLTMDNYEDFKEFSDDMITFLVTQLYVSNQGGGTLETKTDAAAFASGLFAYAKVRWLGDANKVGVTGEMSGWVLDKDLVNPGIDSIEPCVLLNRQQLDSMAALLTNVVAAGRNAQVNATELLTALKSVVVAGAGDPELLNDVEKLSDSRLVPAFLKELPYHSLVMNLSNEYWAAMQQSEQDEVIQSAETKLKYYEAIYADQSMWMNTDDTLGEQAPKVCPIPLNMLP